MRAAFAAAALALVVAGCGGSGTSGGAGGGAALGYLPADAATVILVSTDVDGDQWEALDRHVFSDLEEEVGSKSLDDAARPFFRRAFDLDWEKDVKPLLGNELAIGVQGDPLPLTRGGETDAIVAALETSGGDLDAVLEKAGFQAAGEASGATLYREDEGDRTGLAVEGETLIVADDEEALRAALARHDGGDGMDADAVDEAFADLPETTLVRAFGGLESLSDQEDLRRFAEVPLVRALRSFGLTVAFAGTDLNIDVAVRTDDLDEADLPLVTGDEAPEIVPREREMSGGNRNQSQTTVFLLRALRAAYPDSRFVRAADAIEKEIGVDFEEEILRQFNGPSASYVSADGRTFAARSEVRDPDALREVLPKLAPHIPALVEGLQGLESEGMALLFLFAPDAPAAAPMEGVKVDPPETEDGLYRVYGLTGEGPAELHLGLIGEVFVVASDEERAREIATAETVEAGGARGAGVLRADLRRLPDELRGIFGIPFEGRELVASLEAATDGLRARVRLELED